MPSLIQADDIFSVSIFSEQNAQRAGFEVSGTEILDRSFSVRVSGLIYLAEHGNNEADIYTGLSLSAFYHLNQPLINPYFGAGIFTGETFYCDETDENYVYGYGEAECEPSSVLAVYPEIGLSVQLGPLNIHPYVRRYYDTNFNTKTQNAYGAYFGFKF